MRHLQDRLFLQRPGIVGPQSVCPPQQQQQQQQQQPGATAAAAAGARVRMRRVRRALQLRRRKKCAQEKSPPEGVSVQEVSNLGGDKRAICNY